MPPRGTTDGLDFTPILTHYLFLFTTILAVVGWFLAFIAQIVADVQFGHGVVGVLWFAIFLQLFLILGVLHTLASDSIAMNRFQISTFGSIAIVFAIIGVNQGIFAGAASLDAMGAGWLILAIVDILWVLYFTSEDDSLTLHVFNSLGTGGLTPPSRRRRTRGPSVHGMGAPVNGGYSSPYASGGGYDAKPPASVGKSMGMGTMSQAGSVEGGPPRSIGSAPRPMSGVGSQGVTAAPMATSDSNASHGGANSPLMGSLSTTGGGMRGDMSAGMGGGASTTGGPEPIGDVGANTDFSSTQMARALYAYTASPEDPNEISFVKGEHLEILDHQGKWWQAKKSSGQVGIAPSNYLQII